MTYREPTQPTLPSSYSDSDSPSLEQKNYGFYDGLGLQNEYDFKHLVFPDDLGRDDSAHIMVININVPVTGLARIIASQKFGSIFNKGQFYNTTEQFSKLDILRGITNTFGSRNATIPATELRTPFANTGVTETVSGQARMARSTKRIKESIALYVPVQMVHTTNHMYEEIRMTNMIKKGIDATAGALAYGGPVGAILGAAVQGITGSVTSLSKQFGAPINPRVEILFENTQQRQYTFELLMAPRNEKESNTIKSIIKTLRFHAAPELAAAGMLFIPPAEFDITFFHRGKENLNMTRINTCVLERISHQYDPAGLHVTFSNGHPVTVQLLLGFREIEIGHKMRIAQGF